MRSFLDVIILNGRHQKLKFRAAILLYLMVLVLGSIPGARAEIGEFASGLVLHGLTYCLITFLLFSSISGNALSKALKSFLIVAAMGATDEFVQSFFSYRSASLMDWFVDLSAAFFTATLLSIIWPKAPQNSEQP
jgi:VanZ family protein